MREHEIDRVEGALRPHPAAQSQARAETAARVRAARTGGGQTDHGGVGLHPTRPAATLDASSILHLQRTAGNASVVQMLADEEPSPVHDVVGRGGGAPLDSTTRTSMESAFGTSFGDVRIHTDQVASRSAESVGANAYTVGSDVVFRSGHFDPGSSSGQRTLAHELSHVVQQRSGPVEGSEAPGGIRVSDPSDRFEQAADRSADRALSSVAGAGDKTSAGGDPAIQRELEPELAPPVQREVGPEDEEEEAEVG